jgi:GAF domain-containing protein
VAVRSDVSSSNRGVLLGATASGALALVDLAAGPELVTTAVWMVGPLLAASFSRWRPVLALGAVVVAVGIVSGSWNEVIGTWGHVYRLGLLSVGCAAAAMVAHSRERRDRQLADAARRLARTERDLASAFRLDALRRLTSALLAARTSGQVARAVALTGIRLFGADRVVLHGVEGRHLQPLEPADPETAWNQRVPLGGDSPMAGLHASAGPLIIDSAAEIQARFPAWVAEAPSALAGIRLEGGGRVLGTVLFTFDDALALDHDDLGLLLATVGSEIAQALDRARLTEDLVEERDRVEALQAATEALSRARSTDEAVAIALDQAAAAARADGCIVSLLAETGDRLVLAGAAGIVAALDDSRGVSWSLDVPWALSEVVRSRQSVWLADREEWERRYPGGAGLFQGQAEAAGILPMLDGDEVVGALHFSFGSSLPSPRDRRVAETLTAMVARALNRLRRTDHERRVAVRFQELLLRSGTPVAPGVEWAARYAPASAGLQIGGDWYDLLQPRPGVVAVTVGDVVGHGLEAAVTMSELRSAARAYVLTTNRCDAVLAKLSQYTCVVGRGRYSSAVCAVLDIDQGELAYSVAGHPPPLLIPLEGPAEVLDRAQSPLLGPFHPPAGGEARRRVSPGDTVVFYTDGLIGRGQPPDEAVARLRSVVDGHRRSPPSLVVDAVVDELIPDGSEDDAVVLVLRYHGPEAG